MQPIRINSGTPRFVTRIEAALPAFQRPTRTLPLARLSQLEG
jgi:hypothetical protein